MDRRTLTRTLLTGAVASVTTPRLLAAQTPVAFPAATGEIRRVDIEGFPLALSPDGTLLVGTIDRERLAAWDTATLELVARSEPLRELSVLDDASIAWSPRSDAVAFSLNAARNLRDSDIYVFDIDTGTITNLTDDEPVDEDAVSLMGLDPALPPPNVDMYPSWSADGSSLIFARTVWDADAPETPTEIWSIPREGGEATQIASIAPYPMHVSAISPGLEDGSVLLSTWMPTNQDPTSPDHGIFLVAPDGGVESISTGMLASTTPNMVLLDVAPAAGRASLVSTINYQTLDDAEGPIWIEMDLDTGIPTAFEEVLSLPAAPPARRPDDILLIAAPAFITDDAGEVSGYLYATANGNYDTFTLWQHDVASGEAASLGTLDQGIDSSRPRDAVSQVTLGTNGTVAIFHAGYTWLAAI